jgi:hypothetical protein
VGRRVWYAFRVNIWARTLFLSVAVLVAPRARSSVAIELTIGDLTREADLVVVGTVTLARVAWSVDHRRILTRAFLKPEEAWKGTIPGGGVVVLLPGGELEGLGQRVSGVPEVAAGERVVLFLRRRGDSFRLVGMSQGLFRVPQAAAGATELAIRNFDGLKLVPVGSSSSHSEEVLSLPLDALRASVTAAAGAGPGR